MAQTKPLKFDIKSSFDEEAAKAFGAKSLEELYTEMLLPSVEQKASAAASTIYGQRKQQAAETASYDISKAYANYLKQQRNIAGAAQLETGHKEELSSALRSDYETAYSQARASESQILSKAASEASDIYSDVYKTESAAAKSLYDTLMKDVNLKTDLYKALEEKVFSEEYIQSLGINTGYTTESGEYVPFNVYETVDGTTQLTDYGRDIMSRALLEDPDTIGEYLEKSGREDLQDYYMNNAASFRELAYGITDSEYRLSEESKELSRQRLFGTEGYIESIKKPNEINPNVVNWGGANIKDANYNAAITDLDDYGERLQLTQNEMVIGLGSVLQNLITEEGVQDDVKQAMQNVISRLNEVSSPKQFFDTLSKELRTAKAGYIPIERYWSRFVEGLTATAKNKYTKK